MTLSNSIVSTRRTDGRRRGSVLIVDDTQLNLQILSDVLAPEGYDIITATDGETGLRLARQRKPDLVLLDLVLPGMMGIEVLDVLKQEQPETIVILTTAFGSEETAIQAMRRGVNDYIINKRPFDADEVREVVGRAMSETQLRQENLRLQRELTLANQQLKEYAGHLEQTVEELRAANARLKELDQSKASFFSMISHELRHPLTVAKGYLELVTGNNSQMDPETRGYLEISEQNLKNLAQMIDDLLDLSRLEAGYYQVDRQVVRVSSLVNQTKRAMDTVAASKGIKLRTELNDGLPLVSADPLRITQVLTNLVDNAIKFTPSGGTVTISAADAGSVVECCVSDTGIGIPSAELEKIFERFYQIKNRENPNPSGAGLGLAISREIVRLHGGQIWAESQLGHDTRVTFTLPKAAETESP